VQSTVDLFVRLFRGRGEARGSWGGPAIREPVTPELFHRHLLSSNERDWFGVYNVIGERCSWGCVDIDVDDLPLARNVWASLAFKNVTSWIEQTTRGYHVWVFPLEPLVPAGTMRRALTAACRAVGYSPKEVFPKQTSVPAGGLGNFVRLPYNGYWSDGDHVPRMFVEHTNYLTAEPIDPLGRLLTAMDGCRTPSAVLERLAATMPEAHRSVSVHARDAGDVEGVVANLSGLAYRIWRDGPLPGSDRSTTLVHLARLCAAEDVPPMDAMAVLISADYRWGKDFMDRGAAGEAILERIVEKAYG
jgi:hypothetical protein